jgi:hypothetical protein
MAAPRQPLNPATHSVGLSAKLVTVRSISADGATAITVDRQGTQVAVTMLMQRSKAPPPAPGEMWIITQDLGTWTFAAFAAASPADLPAAAAPAVTASAAAPAAPAPGDLWVNAAQGNALTSWSGSRWVPLQVGTNAIADRAVTAAKIAPGTITGAQLAPAAGITAGQLSVTASDLGGTSVITGTSQPPAPVLGDIWINPAQGNSVSVWDGGGWRLLQFGSRAIAAGSLTALQLAANAGITPGQVDFTASDIGGVTTSVGFSQPSSPAAGDLWFNGNQGFALTTWNGSNWVPFQFGTQSIAAGSVTAALIAANTITAAQIAAGTITAAQIAAGTITAEQIAAGIVLAGVVDGTTIEGGQFIAFGTSGEILVYSGTPALGNLIGSWSAAAGADGQGNPYPAGLFVAQGGISGLNVNSCSIASGSFQDGSISASTIAATAISGGTMTETDITFDTVGGVLYAYTTTTTTITQPAAGTYSFTPPPGIPSGKIECWGAAAGANHGNGTTGQDGGGAGEYACEPSYPLDPTGATTYSYTVGNGGNGAYTGNSDGQGGGDTFFDGTGVYANGGDASPAQGTGGAGGTGSANTIHHDGGSGMGVTGGHADGGSGGGSGGPSGAGGNGVYNGPGGAAGAGGGGAGGASGGSAASGASGSGPGGGGGGSGQSTTTSPFSRTYNASSSASYYGTDIGGAQRNAGGSVYQGASSGAPAGNQFGFWLLPSSVQSDLSGVTITSASVKITNQHSWYGSGMTITFGWSNRTSFPGTISSLGSGDKHGQYQAGITEGATKVINPPGLGAALKSGAAKSLMTGPSTSEPDLTQYGYFAGGASSASVTVTGTSGSSSQPIGGSGADGQVKITYVSSSVLECALSPQAGTDPGGNAYAAGYTGPVTAFQPGVIPAVPEVPHSFSLANSWTGTFKYKYRSDNTVMVSGILNVPSGVANNSNITVALPAAYWPASNQPLGCVQNAGSPFLGIPLVCEMLSTGVVHVYDATAGDTVRIFGTYPLDF